ncbi:MAG: HAD family phosphatase [Candidatus Lokiarchaeota archaeon]|nr:HAD family phosphatase [Candidatus Lokiarchaeota archaeon]
MIRNIIFDLGNVLINFKPETFLLRYTKDEQYIQNFISKVIRNKIWFRLDRGTISLENAKEEFIRKYPEDYSFIITFFEHWMEMLTPIQENVKILCDLKANGYNTYILSNYIEEAFEIMEKKYKFFSLFDGKIISGQEKVIKPEIEIYQKLIDKYNLVPEECVFIDDIRSFLSRARKLKMKTILFTPNTDLRTELRTLDIRI